MLSMWPTVSLKLSRNNIYCSRSISVASWTIFTQLLLATERRVWFNNWRDTIRTGASESAAIGLVLCIHNHHRQFLSLLFPIADTHFTVTGYMLGRWKCRTGKDELRLKQPPTSSTSELSQNCVGLLHEVVDVRVHFSSKVPYYRTVLRQQLCRIDLSAETSP